MRQWTIALSMGLLALLMLAAPASAGRKWCARDPIFALNGHEIQLWVGIPEEYQTLVTGPVDVQISVPAGVSTSTLFLDGGFNGYGEKVTFTTLKSGKVYADGAFDLQFQVKIPINTKKANKIPLQLTFLYGGDAEEVSPGVWNYIGGTSKVVEMTNAGTTLTARYPGSGS